MKLWILSFIVTVFAAVLAPTFQSYGLTDSSTNQCHENSDSILMIICDDNEEKGNEGNDGQAENRNPKEPAPPDFKFPLPFP